MLAAEVRPRDDPRRKLLETCAGELAHQRLAAELLPPRLRLAVVHHEIGVAQVAGRPEVEGLLIDASVEGDRRVAKRTEGDRDRHAPDDGVHDFMPDEDLDRVGAGVASHDELDHRLAILEEVGVLDEDEPRIVDRRDAVLAGPPGHELVERDAARREVGLPAGAKFGRRRGLAQARPVSAAAAGCGQREEDADDKDSPHSASPMRRYAGAIQDLPAVMRSWRSAETASPS